MVGVLFVSAMWFLPKATVTVYVEPKSLDKNVDVVLSTSATSVDPTTSTIPAAPVEKMVAGEDSIPVTGKKTVGDQATGEVTIYNRTSVSKTFPKDTVLTAKSLKFTLVDSVSVASKSAGQDYVDVPGKAVAKIKARAIGTESNLSEGTEFTIESFAKDTYIAKNDKALSGGTSREVTVVDKSDKDTLANALKSRLREQGETDLKNELGEGVGVYVGDGTVDITEESYSAEIGAEATSLSGSMQATVKGVQYATRDVETLIAQELASSIPAGYQKTTVAPEVELGELLSEDEDKISIPAKIHVKLTPIVDTEIVKQALRGVSTGEINSSLHSVIGFKGAEVEITPTWLPPRFKWMPRNSSNIMVTIVPAM